MVGLMVGEILVEILNMVGKIPVIIFPLA